MAQSVVLVSKDNGIATVTLNRPESLNALNGDLRRTFCNAMAQLRTDPEVGVVIITGAGRAFCAGLDLKEISQETLRQETSGVTFISVIEQMEVPVIAAVNGYAITGGLELALACDMIVAAENAQFADTHARVGVMPGGGMSQRLVHAIGIRRAKEMSFTGNYLSAPEAERLGLVNRVVPAAQLMAAATELARQILSADQLIIRQEKHLIDLGAETTLGEGLRLEQDFFRAYSSSNHVSDFAERRKLVQERGRTQVHNK